MTTITNITDNLISKATLKKAIIFTAIFAAMYALINASGVGVAGLLKITGGANILDFEVGYTYEQAKGLLTALGAEGRSFYLTRILPLDFLFPFSYMLFYTGWIALFLKYITVREWMKFALVLPGLNMLFDWIENIGIIAMLRSYPDLPEFAVYTSSIAGTVKMTLAAANIALICIFFVLFLVKKVRARH